MLATILQGGAGCVRRQLGCFMNQERWRRPLVKLCSSSSTEEHRKPLIKMREDYGVKGSFDTGISCYARRYLDLSGSKRFFINPPVQKYMMTPGIGLPHFQNCKSLLKTISECEDFTPKPREVPGQKDVLFPGPLMSEKMQKDDLIRFIQSKHQECFQKLSDFDQQKFYFFWLIMELYYKRNGRVMMAEMAAVLFKGHSCVRKKLGISTNKEDWCIPLARLLCSSAKGEDKRKAIVEMGDYFVFRGWTFAGQICYVVARMDLGSRKRFDLIGCDQTLKYRSASKDMMERTEVYEHALSLTSGIGQPHFQPFKYLYARKLAEDGHSDQALDYCESVAKIVFTMPRHVNTFFVERLVKLSNDLLQKEAKETEWVLKLCRLLRTVRVPYPNISADWVLPSSSQEFQEELDSRYAVGELLGKGAFGAVYAGVRKEDGRPVALKYVTKTIKDSFPGAKPKEVMLTEIVSKPPRCENVVELLGWLDVSTCTVLVLERPSSSIDLKTFCDMKKNDCLSEQQAREIMRQVLQAVNHCHARGVSHGDIRSKNILVNPDTLEVKLIDFGCGNYVKDKSLSSSDIDTVQSLGLLLMELLCRLVPFDSPDIMIKKCSKIVSKDCIQVLSLCLTNHRNAPTFEEILNQRWFQEKRSPVHRLLTWIWNSPDKQNPK